MTVKGDYSSLVDPFWGNGAVQSRETTGMARGWNWLKAQTGNTHPGALMPFGWVSACPYSGAYPTGYGKNGVSSCGPAPQIFSHLAAWGITHFHPIGTGNVKRFYNYFLCTPSSPSADLSRISDLIHEDAHPGYFRGTLKHYKADFELTCTETAAVHKYRFHEGRGHVSIDCNAAGLRIHMGSYSEHIDCCSAHCAEPGQWRGYVIVHGITIWFAVMVLGRFSCNELNNGVIEYDFEVPEAELTLGFSLTDLPHAEANAAAAFEAGFDKVRSNARCAWKHLLGTVKADFRTEAERKRFYTILYHSFTKPCRHDGGYIDFTTMWDIYRTQLPLMLSLSGDHARNMLLSMVETIERLGHFPIFYFMNSDLNAENNQASALVIYTLCDGYVRGILTGEDYPRVKAAMQKEFACVNVKGKSPTHLLDLAGACEAARIIADQCGDHEYAAELKSQSSVWEKAYDPGTGYLIKDAVYYEGDYRNYSFRPHVYMEKRIELAGGKSKFLAMLDDFFAVNYSTDEPFSREIRPGYFEAMNNESDMDAPYAYLWCGRPDRLAEILDTIRRFHFTDGEGGAPGNVDSGALASWYIWACLGIYPLAGSEFYLIGSPSVTEAFLQLTRGILHITVQRENEWSIVPCVVEFNHKKLAEMHIPVWDLEQGGELKFYLR